MPETRESSDEEWEEVEESQDHQEEEDVKPSESVEVELDLPAAVKKRRKKEQWEREMVETTIRRAVKKFDKEMQLAMHEVHLLCLLAFGMRLNRICNNDELKATVYSLLPVRYADNKPKHISAIFLTRFIQDFVKVFEIENGIEKLQTCKLVRLPRLENLLKRVLENKKVQFRLDLVMIFVLALRAMGFNTRLVISMQPVSLKPLTEKQKESAVKPKAPTAENIKMLLTKSEAQTDDSSASIPQVDGSSDSPRARVTRSRVKKNNCPDASKVLDIPRDAKPTKRKKENIKCGDNKNKIPRQITKNGPERLKKATEGDAALTKHPRVVLKRNPAVESIKKARDDKMKDLAARMDETPLLKPLTESKTQRRLTPRTKAKRKIAAEVPKKESDCEEDFNPVKSSDSDDSDFETEMKKSPPKKRRSNVKSTAPAKGRKSTGAVGKGPKQSSVRRSSTGSKSSNDQDFYDHWLEVYSEQEGKWICLDIFRCVVNHPEQMEKYVSPTLHYVLGYENEGYVKDVTARYASKWLTETRKLRVGIADKDWWKETLAPYATPNLNMDSAEKRDMQERLLAQPMPTTISAYKNHPLFGLRRHLLKYEAIYPPDIPYAGLIRGEEVFPRTSIRTLHTRDKWMQEARVVKDGEEPYKMVASMWINMKLKQDMSTLSMPLFGRWQTEPYIPPVAKDGKVPRNKYGNVDLFKPDMIPVGCVQLRLSGLQKIARKLDIDIASAITGFDSHNGYPHPVTDGYIVCKEHEEILVAAWREDQIHVAEREQKKREERVYGHWKFFIKAMLTKEMVKKKYASKDKVSTDKNKNGTTIVSMESGTAWQAKRLEAAKKIAKGTRAKKDENMFPFEMEAM